MFPTLVARIRLTLCPQVGLSIEDIGQFLDTLLQWALVQADSDLQKLSAFHIVSAILNRRANGESDPKLLYAAWNLFVAELSSFLNDKLHNYWGNEIASGDMPLFRRKWAITSWIWVSNLTAIM